MYKSYKLQLETDQKPEGVHAQLIFVFRDPENKLLPAL